MDRRKHRKMVIRGVESHNPREMEIWGEVSMGSADTSPTSILVHLWIKLRTDHYCLTNCLNTKEFAH
jgi:hypothetical protein